MDITNNQKEAHTNGNNNFPNDRVPAVPGVVAAEEESTSMVSTLQSSAATPDEVLNNTSSSTTKRKRSSAYRDAVLSNISCISGSFDSGGVFACGHCGDNRRWEWVKGFNVSLARKHLLECPSVPSSTQDLLNNLSQKGKRRVLMEAQLEASVASTTKNVKETTTPAASKQKPQQQLSLTNFTLPHYQMTVIPKEVATRVIRAKIEEHLASFDSPVRVVSPYSKIMLVSALGKGVIKYFPSIREI